MQKLLVYLLISLLGDHALSAPQDSEASIASELDYYEPGVTSEDCFCVPFDQCVDGEIVSDGSNIMDPRTKPQGAKECGPYHVCCRDPDSSTAKPEEPNHTCGMRNPGGIKINGRIVTPHADGEAEFGEWPWQAAILGRDGSELVFKCSGVLIDERHVLTIAHCVDEFSDVPTNVVVRLGEWDTQTTDEFLPHEDHEVSEVMIHPQYRSNNLFNDIAVLKLDTDVTYKLHVDSACLPRDDDDFTGQNCFVTGWGTDAYKSGSFSTIMKEISLPVLAHGECQKMLRKTRLGQYFKLHKGFICAGGNEGEDSCKGDGGGPLVCNRSDSSFTVAGLVSWGIDCGQPNVPGIYVNVKSYIDWIASKTQKPIEDYWNS